VTVADPLVPVTAKLYNPKEVVAKVVMVSEGDAGGVIGVVGLGSQVGRLTGCGICVVTTQVNVTGAFDPAGWRLSVAVEVPPGSTGDGESGDATVRVN
jgi:hypothetical protein